LRRRVDQVTMDLHQRRSLRCSVMRGRGSRSNWSVVRCFLTRVSLFTRVQYRCVLRFCATSLSINIHSLSYTMLLRDNLFVTLLDFHNFQPSLLELPYFKNLHAGTVQSLHGTFVQYHQVSYCTKSNLYSTVQSLL